MPVSLDSTYKYIYLDQNETITLNVASLTSAGDTATATIATPHNLSTGKVATIAGANETYFNGSFVVTVTSATAFTYELIEAHPPSSTATGTITAAYIGVALDDAELVNGFILASMECFEKITHRTLMNASFKTFRNCWDCFFELRKAPLVSVESVKYNDENEDEQTVTNTLYYTTVDPFYSKLIFTDDFTSPTTSTRQQSIFIEFTAGFGTDESDIPDDIQLAIQAHVAFLWENRGDCPNASDESCMPCQTRKVFRSYKVEEI